MAEDDGDFWELFGEWGRGFDETPLPCTVQPCIGQGSHGAVFGPAEEHPGMPRMNRRRLVRNSTGNETMSSAVVFVPWSLRDSFPLHSLIDLGNGRQAAVLERSEANHSGIFAFVKLRLE